MPENVPPKETAKADGLNPTEQAPGVPRAPAAGPASVTPPPPGAPASEALPGVPARAPATPPPGAPARAPAAPAAPADDHPGDGFVRIRWKEKIGGHEADEEWAEERRARGLVASGHAEIVEEKGKK